MRILQLTSDWKWTGPAEPMLKLALGQRSRGHEIWVACPEAAEDGGRSIAAEARVQGIPPALEISRGRGARVFADRPDVHSIARFCDAESVDVVHSWHTRDHVLALRAARVSKGDRPAVVRSYRSAEKISRAPWSRLLFGPLTAGLLCVSPETARWNANLRRGRPIRENCAHPDVRVFRNSQGIRTCRIDV